MIDFTYNPIIPADYKSHGKRTSLRSLSLRSDVFYRRRLRRIQTVENAAGWHDEVVTEGVKFHALGIFRTTTA